MFSIDFWPAFYDFLTLNTMFCFKGGFYGLSILYILNSKVNIFGSKFVFRCYFQASIFVTILLIFLDRFLYSNQIQELPPGVFDKNIQLEKL